jgi:cell division protein FtsW
MADIYRKSIDQTYLVMILILTGIGFVIQYSASSSIATERFNDPSFFMKGHLVRIAIGLIVCGICLVINYQKLKSLAISIAIFAILLLIVTPIYNKANGLHSSARWISIGPLNLQTSELTKFAVILYLASFLDRHRDRLNDFKTGFLPAALILVITVLLVIISDFSTAIAIALLGFIILMIGGTKLKHLASLIGALLIISTLFLIKFPYRLSRISTLLNPGQDTQGMGYQIYQSLITLGNGGLFGRGLADSVEKNLFLPDPHTDFVFAVAGEELGFITITGLLILFLLIYIRGIKISLRAPDIFGNLLGTGLSTSMFLYVILNVGVVCGIFPVTGLPLPFISYGGSAMIYNFLCVGIILNISRYSIPKYNPLVIVKANE